MNRVCRKCMCTMICMVKYVFDDPGLGVQYILWKCRCCGYTEVE
jgi:hypothetical protein